MSKGQGERTCLRETHVSARTRLCSLCAARSPCLSAESPKPQKPKPKSPNHTSPQGLRVFLGMCPLILTVLNRDYTVFPFSTLRPSLHPGSCHQAAQPTDSRAGECGVWEGFEDVGLGMVWDFRLLALGSRVWDLKFRFRV